MDKLKPSKIIRPNYFQYLSPEQQEKTMRIIREEMDKSYPRTARVKDSGLQFPAPQKALTETEKESIKPQTGKRRHVGRLLVGGMAASALGGALSVAASEGSPGPDKVIQAYTQTIDNIKDHQTVRYFKGFLPYEVTDHSQTLHFNAQFPIVFSNDGHEYWVSNNVNVDSIDYANTSVGDIIGATTVHEFADNNKPTADQIGQAKLNNANNFTNVEGSATINIGQSTEIPVEEV